MHVSAWNVALEAVNFLVLAWLLGRFLWRPVTRVIERRRAEIEAQLGEAAAARERARKIEAEHEAGRAALAAEARREREEARRRAEEEAREIREDAARRARELSERTRAALAEERARALAELRAQAIDLAVAIAEKLLGDLGGSRGEGALAQVMRGLSDPEKRRMLTRQLAGGPVEVSSAIPIDGAEAQRLRAWLADLAGRPVEVSFRVEPSLLAGVELRFPHGSCRYSAGASLAQIAAALKEQDDGAG